MEVFTFIYMGGDVGRITVLPMGSDFSRRRDSSGRFDDLSDPSVKAILDKFAAFDAEEAQCYLAGDKQMILGVIETGIGSIEAFNDLVRNTFVNRGPNRASSSSIVLGMEKSNSREEVDEDIREVARVTTARLQDWLLRTLRSRGRARLPDATSTTADAL